MMPCRASAARVRSARSCSEMISPGMWPASRKKPSCARGVCKTRKRACSDATTKAWGRPAGTSTVSPRARPASTVRASLASGAVSFRTVAPAHEGVLNPPCLCAGTIASSARASLWNPERCGPQFDTGAPVSEAPPVVVLCPRSSQAQPCQGSKEISVFCATFNSTTRQQGPVNNIFIIHPLPT